MASKQIKPKLSGALYAGYHWLRPAQTNGEKPYRHRDFWHDPQKRGLDQELQPLRIFAFGPRLLGVMRESGDGGIARYVLGE